MALPSRSALLDEDGNGGQRGNRIEPWNMECGIHRETNQGDKRNVGASSGLHCIGGQGGILAEASLAALEKGQDRHCDERSNRDCNTAATCLRAQAKDQLPQGNYPNQKGEREEQDGGRTVCLAFRD